MGSLEDIPDVGNNHMTSVQVFIVRDSYLAKTTTRMGGLEGGRLERGGKWCLTLGEGRCVWVQGEAYGHLFLFTPPLGGRRALFEGWKQRALRRAF